MALSRNRNLRSVYALDDFECAARSFLPRPIFAYVASRSETGSSCAANRQAFDELAFVPRVLNDVSGRTLTTNLFGKRFSAPFGIAPMGMSSLIAYRGDLVLAQAARTANIPMIMSGASLIRLEEVAAANPDAWFQAYFMGDTTQIKGLLDRVGSAGFGTLVVTVDAPVAASPENTARSGFSAPLKPGPRLAWDGMIRPHWTVGTFLQTFARHGMPHFENAGPHRGAPILAKSVVRTFAARDRLSWEHIHFIRRKWKGRLVLKGIAAAEDVRLAARNGVDAVILSNHGGRQLDGAIAPMRTLAAAVAAAGNMPIMLDGGIRRGSDVLKALALGAQSVFVGRPFLYAAAVAGQRGVEHAIDILTIETLRNLGLLGLAEVGGIGPAFVRNVHLREGAAAAL